MQHLLAVLNHAHSLLRAEGTTYKLILLDPPWENKSVQRSGSYPTLFCKTLLSLPVPHLLAATGGVVAMWMTNRGRLHRFVEQELLPAWGMTCVATWWWLKCGGDGQPTTPLSSQHRHPYESLVLLRRSGGSQHRHTNCTSQHAGRADQLPTATAAASLPTATAVREDATGANVRGSSPETAADCAAATGAGRSRGSSPREPCGVTARGVFRDGVVLFSLRDPTHSRKPQVGKLLWHLMQLPSRAAAEAPPDPVSTTTTTSHCELQAIPGAETPVTAPDAPRRPLTALGSGQLHPVSAPPTRFPAKGLHTSGAPLPPTSPGRSVENEQRGCEVPGGARQHQRGPASSRGGSHCREGMSEREVATTVAEGGGFPKPTRGWAPLPLRARVEPLPCLELFAREMQAGWTSWGNEVLRFQDAHLFGVDEGVTRADPPRTASAAPAAAGKLL
ncbi:MAG: hypothetical protein WDW38_002798 [Sanguina aurantia]